MGAFSNAAGRRPFTLYIPAGYRGRPAPLIVMLHGCDQSADDLAAVSRMNAQAEAAGCLVVYPAQVRSANVQRCWNWFDEANQRRDSGELSIIVGIVREIADGYAVDPAHVHVAGMSAGGAMAASLAQTYPDLFASVGVHSGLAFGAARSPSGAVVAMRRGGGSATAPVALPPGTLHRVVPTIVFHGDRDSVVNVANSDVVAAQVLAGVVSSPEVERGRINQGRAYTVTRHRGGDGETLVEHWVVHGAGHGWSGGAPATPYTDPMGPDASAAMLRFFLDHPHPGPGVV